MYVVRVGIPHIFKYNNQCIGNTYWTAKWLKSHFVCTIWDSVGGEYEVDDCLLGSSTVYLWNVKRRKSYTREHDFLYLICSSRQPIPFWSAFIYVLICYLECMLLDEQIDKD